MFNLLSNMRWPYPGPTTGSVYEQDPDWIDKVSFIFSEKNKHEAAEQRKRETESRRNSASGGKGMRRRPRS